MLAIGALRNLALPSCVHTEAQQMQLGFTEEATQPKEQPIIILTRIIHSLRIGQECPHDRGEINEGIPIRVVTSQATSFIGENDPDTAEGDRSNQFLKAWALSIFVFWPVTLPLMVAMKVWLEWMARK